VIRVEKAGLDEAAEAYAIVAEYYEAVQVVVREDAAEFREKYFGPGAGIWLARDGAAVVGCIALRPLKEIAGCGEVKRLYVKPEYRGRAIAERLLEALEAYAREWGYGAIYLDSKDDLKAALRFYARHGYAECARYNENPQATVFMRKELGREERRMGEGLV
jgi:GNAT superfamily N-acetyltransferase